MKWTHVDDGLPMNNTECLIYSDEHEQVIGPILWKREQDDETKPGVWLDLFATPEAGHAYSPKKPVTYWVAWEKPTRGAP